MTATGSPRSATAAIPAATSVTVWDRAVGTPAAAMTSLAKALLPSSRAAAADGPKARTPMARRASQMPATSGAAGPPTPKSARSAAARAATPPTSSMLRGISSASRAMPTLPPAQ